MTRSIIAALLILLYGIIRAIINRYNVKAASGNITVAVTFASTVLTWPYFMAVNDVPIFGVFSAIKGAYTWPSR